MTWSLSRWKTYDSCHAKYDYKYNLGLPDGERGPAALRGVKVHKEIEESLKGTSPLPVEADFVGLDIDAIRISGIPASSEHNIKLDREWKLVVAGPYWFHGIVDLLTFPSEVKADVWDWKTGRIYPDHDLQGELYAVATFSAFPELEEVETKFAYLDQGKTKTKTYMPHMVEPAKERWTRRVERMEAETEFLPMPGYGCRWCPYSAAKGGPCRF